MPLRITLQDYAGAQPAMMATAIARFRRELERKLGHDAEAAFKAFQNASESSASELTKEELRLATEYSVAYQAARTVGFRDLGDVQEAYFDVRPD